MIIKYIKFKEVINESKDILSNRFNLITSKGINSVGKSTYCRLLFYALGYSIPPTENIKFEKIYSEIGVLVGEKEYIIKRERNILYVQNKDCSFKRQYFLPNDHIAFLSFLFNINNPMISRNLLGLMYIDQEKGWTLLNRGKVIGGIRFSIDELVAALQGVDCDELFAKRNTLEDTIDKYQSLLKMNSIKEEYYEDNDNLNILSGSEELNRRIAALQLSIKDIKNDLKEIDAIIKQDEDFFSYIESMNLSLRYGEKLIKITKDNIVNSCSTEFLRAQKSILESELYNLTNQKVMLSNKLASINEIPNLFGESAVSTEKSINKALSLLNLDVYNIQKSLDKAKSKLETINIEIRNKMRYCNEYVQKIYNLIERYSYELKIEKSITKNIDFIFTNNLKCKTGANFQKLIIAYKVAIIKVVESVINEKLILVIDSPKAKELDDTNTSLIMNFLKDKLSENQVIVASIYKQEDLFIDFNRIIRIKNKAIEKRGK